MSNEQTQNTGAALVVPQTEALDLIGIGGEITVDDITNMVAITARRGAKKELADLEAQLKEQRSVFDTQKKQLADSCQQFAQQRYGPDLQGAVDHLLPFFPRVATRVTASDDVRETDMSIGVTLYVGLSGSNDRYYNNNIPDGFSTGMSQTVRLSLAEPQLRIVALIRETMITLKDLGGKIDDLRRFLYDGVKMVEEQFKVDLLGMKLGRAGESGKAIAELAANFIKSEAIQDLLPECLRAKMETPCLPEGS